MSPLRRIPILLVLTLAASLQAGEKAALSAYKPNAKELQASYKRANGLSREFQGKVFRASVQPNWIEGGKKFWYRNALKGGTSEFVLVDAEAGKKEPAFDHVRLAKALSEATGTAVAADKLPFTRIAFVEGKDAIRFRVGDQGWEADLKSYKLEKADVPATPTEAPPRNGRRQRDASMTSPDGKWTARLADRNVYVKPKDGEEIKLTALPEDGTYFDNVDWTRDSKQLIARKVFPGDRRQVFLVQSSPPGGGRAVLKSRQYDLPGDKLDTDEYWMLDVANRTSKRVETDPLDTWLGAPYVRWENNDQKFTVEKLDRGYQRWRVIEVDPSNGTTRTVIDDQAKTFIDTTAKYVYYCRNSDEIIWRSEQDGWGHLYLTDQATGDKKQITKGNWVVRGVDRVDEKQRQIWFHASGMNPKEDPYFIQYYRVNYDGTNLVALTEGNGTHAVQFSPDNAYLIDSYSQVDVPPVTTLRRASDGKFVCELEKTDISELKAAGWRAPESFVAKGRDGTTDIWGVVYRPLKFDAHKTYPIIENIYAGPQDSFTPKNFAAYRGMQALAELGFIVVQMDGMGTRNRSKAFHDVCWQNLGDAGFPDRILWMKALAAKYPYMDINRVGIYGTSAGGQNSTGAVLFHPEFYKVAVSSCGCHDNRMDKIWWNEQWMGYPVGPQYSASSNIDNAAKLQGKLFLMVGELDTNVPPESTYRLVDALMKAGKEFQFLVIPGSDHTDGGPYGEHKRRDFFVHNLLGVEPPTWNQDGPSR